MDDETLDGIKEEVAKSNLLIDFFNDNDFTIEETLTAMRDAICVALESWNTADIDMFFVMFKMFVMLHKEETEDG